MKIPPFLGVVGCGYWGQNLLRNFKNLSSVRLSSMCDLNEARLDHLKTLYPDVRTFNDFGQFLADSELDAVAIATPVQSHFELAKACLLAGKHTFVEKPMATKASDCQELIDIAAEKGLTLMAGHTYLYSAPVGKINEIIQQGEIGTIRHVNSRRLNLGLFQKDINVTWDLAPHDISIILHLMGGSPEIVNCQGNCHVTPGIEDVSNLSLNFGDSRFAAIQSSWLDPRKVREMTIVGTRKMIVYDDLQVHEKDPRLRREGRSSAPVRQVRRLPLHLPFRHELHPAHPPAGALRAECQHFLDCIEHGTKPLSSGVEGLQLVRILEAASLSMKHRGAPVRLEGATDYSLDRSLDRESSLPVSLN